MGRIKTILQVVFVICILLAMFLISKSSQNVKPIQLLETQAAEYIYDTQTDTLVIHSVLENKVIILDLSTKEIILEVEAFAPISFYTPGKYVSLNQETYYDLSNREVLSATTAQSPDYFDANDVNTIVSPTNGYTRIPEDVGLIEAKAGLQLPGMDGYLIEIVDTSAEFMGGGSRSQTWNVTKDGQQFTRIKLGNKNYPSYILPFPQNRKEMFILGHFGVSYVVFP